MENLVRGNVLKKIVAFILIIATVLSVFPMSVFAALDDDQTLLNNKEKVQLRAAWASGDEINEGSGSIDFVIVVNGVQTGFRNIQLMVSTDEVDGIHDYVSVSEGRGADNYKIVNYGSRNTGTSIRGNAGISFGDPQEVMERTVRLKVTGEYTDPETNTVEQFSVSATPLKARVIPSDKSVGFTANLRWADSQPTVSKYTQTLGMNQYGGDLGYYTKSVTVNYPLELMAGPYTQSLSLKIKFSRSDGTIDWNGLDEVLGAPTVNNLANGAVEYVFTRGADSDQFVQGNTFGIFKEFNIKYTLNTEKSNPLLYSEPELMSSFGISFDADLSTTGFSTYKKYDEDLVVTKQNEKNSLSDTEHESLNRYTPGGHEWRNWSITSAIVGGASVISENLIDSIKNGEKIYISVDAIEVQRSVPGEVSKVNGTLRFSEPIINYIDENGYRQSLTLSNDKIRLRNIDSRVSYYAQSYFREEVDGTETEFNDYRQYTPSSEENISSFFIKMEDFLRDDFKGYSIYYELDTSDLGLTEEEIDNITSFQFSMNTSGQWLYGGNNYYVKRVIPKDENDYSNMGLICVDNLSAEYDDLGVTKHRKLTLFMSEAGIPNDTDTIVNYAKNVNPIFYVTLPSAFKYGNINTAITDNNSIAIDEENIDIIKVNGDLCLVIPCIGTYDSRTMSSCNIDITFDMTLTNPTTGSYYVNAYMITDNEQYATGKRINSYDLERLDGTVPEFVQRDYEYLEVTGVDELRSLTTVERDGVRYEPNPNNTKIEEGEKELPLLIKEGEKVTFNSEIQTKEETLKNIVVLSRLPFANNTLIDDNNNTPLIETDYALPHSFYEKNGLNVIGNEEGNPVIQNSLTNIKVQGVYVETLGAGSRENELSSDLYSIYYTTDENATFDSNSYVLYQEGDTNFANAKNIKVVLDSSYLLTAGKRISVKYEATMPSGACMVGATTATQYIRASLEGSSIGETETLYSPAAYVINGNTESNIIVQKKFQDYEVGYSREGVSLSGIQFKLQYYNEQTKTKEFLKDEYDNDIVAVTDSTGKAEFLGVNPDTYFLYEVTEFDYYTGIGDMNLISVDAAETVNYQAVNKLKKGTIVIEKKWENTNEFQGKVSFKLHRVNEAHETSGFTDRIVESDENGVVTFNNVPYGNYEVSEVSGPTGWTPVTKTINVALFVPEVRKEYTNKLSKGILQIVKTVPSGETVNGLSFNVKGLGFVKYTTLDNQQFNTDCEYNITVGQSNLPSNIEIQTSDNDTVATITISDLYMGYYEVNEVAIPTISDTEIEKYAPASGSTILYENDEENPVVVSLVNNYKMGTIEINKTAKFKVSENEYADIDDLSRFQVRVQGTSFYGHEVDALISLDSEGYGSKRFEIGTYTITEVPVDGYDTYYGEDSSASTIPPEVTVEYGQKYVQKIYNEHTGIGYVRVEKELEGVEDPQRVVNAGIKFAVVGQNIVGGRVNSEIEIKYVDRVKNVAYGISGPISVGGEYELREVDSTIPDFFEGADPIPVEITTAATLEQPVVKEFTNTRCHGNLEIVTTTDPEGGPLKGITYKVTEVEIKPDGVYEIVGDPLDVEGSNDDDDPSFARIEDMYAGNYLVEQVDVPEGWTKDVKQIVEVPSYGTGYAQFEITKQKELKNNKVIISKEILNSDGEIADRDDFAYAGLRQNESFEVKITNVDTREEFYTFVTALNPGVINGLEAGTYEIEEVYKPKYTTEGYYENIEVARPLPDEGTDIVSQKIEATNGKYLFTINESYENNETVSVTVKNTINTGFGFGGQNFKDNFEKTDVTGEVVVVSKGIVYIVDENGDAIPGAKFQLETLDGTVVIPEFEAPEKTVVIKGLPKGEYVVRCTEVPDGYIIPDVPNVIIYEDATRVARGEVQKDIPRGIITLSTTYTASNGDTKYVPRSKYKIVNKDTGELVRFVRTATGDYRKSNLPDAATEVMLKGGYIELDGIEVGDYEVGITDVTKGYGIIDEKPEDVTIVKDQTTNVNVKVANYGIVKVDAGKDSTMYLNANGELFVLGYSYYNAFGDAQTNYSGQFAKIEFPVPGIKITKFVYHEYGVLAIDSEGRVWCWGQEQTGYEMGGTGNSGSIQTPKCISEDGVLGEEYYSTSGEPTRFVDIQGNGYTTILLDNKGRVWAAGRYTGDGTSDYKGFIEPISIFTQNDVKIKKLAKIREWSYGNGNLGVIDTQGRVWTWGSQGPQLGITSASYHYTPICISELSNDNMYAPLKDVVIEDMLMTEVYSMAIDSDGNLWIWGTAGAVQNTIQGGSISILPTKVDSSYFGGARIKTLAGVSNNSDGKFLAAVIDEYGKLWTWGTGSMGELGNGQMGYAGVPTCVTNDPNSTLYNIKIKDVEYSDPLYYSSSYYCHLIVVDENNRLWGCGGFSQYSEIGPNALSPIINPQIITVSYDEHFEYNLKFKTVYQPQCDYGTSFAIDSEGKLWSWGSNNYSALGYYTNSSVEYPQVVNVPGKYKVTKVESGYYNTIILTENGRVMVAGYGWIGDGRGPAGSSYGIPFTDVTDYITAKIPDDATIVDVYEVDQYSSCAYIVIDSKGRLYTWGSGTSLLGRQGNPYEVQCISDEATEILKDKKIVKITSFYNYSVCALTDNGDVYVWKQGQTPWLLDSTVKFTDINGQFLLDEDGKVWNYYYYDDSLRCISDDPTSPMYKYYKTDSKYKVTKMFRGKNYDIGIFKDSNGKWWQVSGSKPNPNQIEEFDKKISNLESVSGILFLDKSGQIWKQSTGWGSNGELTCLSDTESNPIYRVKMKRIVEYTYNNNSMYTVGLDGTLYHFYGNDRVTIEGISPIDYMEDVLGLEIVESNGVRAIDNEGKLWRTYSDSLECTSDNSPFAELHAADDDYGFVKIYSNLGGNTYDYAIDTNGKLWRFEIQWVSSGGTSHPVEVIKCVNDLAVGGMGNIVSLDGQNNVTIAKDNNGNMWIWGKNEYGELGTGNTSAVNNPIKITLEGGKKVIDYKFIGRAGIVLLEDGSVYVSGNSGITSTTGWYKAGTCEGATNLFVGNNNYYNNQNRLTYIVTGNDKVWCFGYNATGSALCGTLDTENEYIRTPALISEQFTVNGLVAYGNWVRVSGTDGNIWSWGGYGAPTAPTLVRSYASGLVIDFDNSRGFYSDGKIYNYTDGSLYKDYSEIIAILYGEVNNENIVKFYNWIKEKSSYHTYYEIIDGIIYKIYIDSSWDITYSVIGTQLGSELNDKITAKKVVQYSDYKAIDDEGNLYVWESCTGLYKSVPAPVCITNVKEYKETSVKNNTTIVNIPENNDLYNVKVKDLVNDKFVIDEKDNVWYFTVSGKATNISENLQGDENPLYGKTIERKISDDYVVTTDHIVWYIGGNYPGRIRNDFNFDCDYICEYGDFALALDSNGKIWASGTNLDGRLGNGGYTTNGSVVCISDIEGTDLYNAYVNDSTFKIIKAYDNTYCVFAIDNKGKVWTWGKANIPGNGWGAVKVLSPKCLTDIEDTNLYNAYNNDGLRIVDIDYSDYSYGYLIDDQGRKWRYETDDDINDWIVWTSDGSFDGQISADDSIKLTRLASYAAVSEEGYVYTYNTQDGYYTLLNNISNVDQGRSYYSNSSSTRPNNYVTNQDYEGKCLLWGDSGAYIYYWKYRRAYDSRTGEWTYSNYSNTVTQLCGYKVLDVITGSHSQQFYILCDNNTVYRLYSATSGSVSTILSNVSEMITYEIYVLTDGTVVESSGQEFTKYDDVIEVVYGEVTNARRKQFLAEYKNSNGTLFVRNGKTYIVKTVSGETTCEEVDYTKQFVNGYGKISEVVGENEVRTEKGIILRLVPDGTDSYTVSEVDEATEFTTAATEPTITIEGKTLVEQSPHKALDNEGNLYVWEEYTGLSKEIEGVVSLTEEQYSVDPIYLQSNGWSIIKSGY